MKRFDRTAIVPPAELNSNDCELHLETILISPNQVSALSDYYRGKKTNPDGSIEFTVRDVLKALYNCKCAYCEKLSNAPRIDHHRPQGRVVGAGNGNNGYYWLSYEWTNLVPSCTDCNSIEAKGSKYPISGVRNNHHPLSGNPPILMRDFLPYTSQYNLNEIPHILHPEYIVPIDHFQFDKDGKIIGKTVEGIATVRAIKLDNPDLNGWRRKIYNEHLSELRNIARKYFRNITPISEDHFEELMFDWTEKVVNQANDDTLEYTLFRKYLLLNIEGFFINELDVVFRAEIKLKIASSIAVLAT